jgi:alpha-tubulin suppressor-like RCC1 family protein
VRDDGTAWGWGDNTYGELGNGTTTGSSTAVEVTGLADVAQVAAADDFSLALRSDGTVWAWGSGVSGQLGDGGTTNRTTPVQVSGLTGVRQIAAGGSHALALLADGTVRAWGDNAYGELGDGTTTNRSLPVTVTGQVNVSHVAAGFDHSLALRTDGTVRAWGYNGDGELGDGTTINRSTPVTVSALNPKVSKGLSGVIQLSGGAYHSLAVRTDGSVVAWGGNYYGEVGDGTLTNRTIPVAVTGAASGVTRVSAGGYHSVAFRTDGTVQAWGYNHYGQVGDGTTTDRTSPVTVPGLSQVFQVSAGGWHTLALDF